MTSNEINVDSLSYFLSQFKHNVVVYEGELEDIENQIEIVAKEKNDLSRRTVAVMTITRIFDEMWMSFKDKDNVVDIMRFRGVLQKTEEVMSDLRKRLETLSKAEIEEKPQDAMPRSNSKQRTAHVNNQVLNSRQSKEPFILRTLKSGQRFQCNTCKEPILIYTSYLIHLEEYPAASKMMRQHYYHIKVECFFIRGFQEQYLNDARIICEDEINNGLMEKFQEIGFNSENILSKDDSDGDSDKSETMSQNSEASHEPLLNCHFIYRYNDNPMEKKIHCVACYKDIIDLAYITRENSLDQAFHIKKECVQSDEAGSIDFSQVKCKVFKLLRNHSDLKQLLACGFYYNKIIGYRPQSIASKGFLRDVGDESFRTCQFFFRRKDGERRNQNMTCSACKKIIHQNTFLTRGETFDEPYHLKKNCVQLADNGSCDINRVKCIAGKLLRDFKEMKQLQDCGFFYNNIIGVRPKNTVSKNDLSESLKKDTADKDVGFIFNQESFGYERSLQGERCQGCSQYIKRGEFCFRHKERIPREKMTETFLVSQFYHSVKDCLLKRGFTEKYLEFSLCKISLVKSDNRQNVRDIVVRCGFSSDNISYDLVDNIPRPNVSVSKGFQMDSKPFYLFVVNCLSTSAHCGGCGFNISINSPCFLYGQNSLQNSSANFFHINEQCLKNHFTNTEMSSMTCINSNSIAAVNDEDIFNCGITKIDSKFPSNLKKNNRPSKTNPLKLEKLKFVVDYETDTQVLCSACNVPLHFFKFILKVKNNSNRLPAKLHIDTSCLTKFGYTVLQLSQSDLTTDIYISEVIRQRLEKCGFRNIPNF